MQSHQPAAAYYCSKSPVRHSAPKSDDIHLRPGINGKTLIAVSWLEAAMLDLGTFRAEGLPLAPFF